MKMKTFKKGIHPAYNKAETSVLAIEQAPLPARVVLPLQQHIGAPCTALVKKGDTVEEGQLIGEAGSFVSAPVHASISGKVKDVGMYPAPFGARVLSVVIEGDGNARGSGDLKDWNADARELDIETMHIDSLKDAIREAGIVGMGGAAFPTVVKLSPPEGKPIDTVILNGCECEPYLSGDHRLMVERTDKVLKGLRVIMKTLGARSGYIGIEENKPDAISALKARIDTVVPGVEVVELQTKYPQGAEKMLIGAVLGRRVPVGKLPLDVGVVVQNVGTAVAVYEAIALKKPLIERVVTVSGSAVASPRNLKVRIGTAFADLIAQCGGTLGGGEGETVVLNGGPMMGIAQTTLDVPVVKGTSGITVLIADEIEPAEYGPCIKCASCVETCPMSLMPYRLGDLGRMSLTGAFEEWAGPSCMECGCCSFVCPSKRPLLEWIRVGKRRLREAAIKGAA